MSQTPTVFLHVPKTAGTTLREIINRQFRPDLVYAVYSTDPAFHGLDDLKQLTPEQWSGLRVVLGHLDWGVAAWAPPETRFVTLMREPQDRVISLYHHQMTLYRSPEQRLAIPDHIVGSKMIQCDNHQTRILSGENPEFGECRQSMLDRAIENIETRFDVVGLTERFDESLLLMCAAFGWVIPYYAEENVSVARPLSDQLDGSDLEVIAEYNQLDSQLYQYAAQRLDSEIGDRGDNFARELQLFRDKNRSYAALLWPKVSW